MGKLEVVCVTANAGKWAVMQGTLGDLLELRQVPVETPEIQSLDVEEIALFSARWAARELGKSVLKSDVGYYVAALGGFPGPLVKWINQTLVSEQILAMMAGVEDRRVVLREALAYAEPDGFAMVATVERPGIVSREVYPLEPVTNSVFDRIMVEDALGKPFIATTMEERVAYWIRVHREVYRGLGRRILAR